MTQTKNKYGREVVICPDIQAWRKQMRRYRKLKAELLSLMHKLGWDKARAKAWLATPTPRLRNRCPKQLLNPKSINVLMGYARKQLR